MLKLLPAVCCLALLLATCQVRAAAPCDGDDCASITGFAGISRELLSGADFGEGSANKARWPGGGWPKPKPWPRPWPRPVPDPKPQPGPIDKIPAPIDRPGIPVYPAPHPVPTDGPGPTVVTNDAAGATPLRKLMGTASGAKDSWGGDWGNGWDNDNNWGKGKPIPVDPPIPFHRPPPDHVPVDPPIHHPAPPPGWHPKPIHGGPIKEGSPKRMLLGMDDSDGWSDRDPVDPIPFHPAPAPPPDHHIPVDPPVHHPPPSWHPKPVHGPIHGAPKH